MWRCQNSSTSRSRSSNTQNDGERKGRLFFRRGSLLYITLCAIVVAQFSLIAVSFFSRKSERNHIIPMPSGWKKGLKTLSVRQQMGNQSFDRCRCSGCCKARHEARAGYLPDSLTEKDRMRKNVDLLVLYKQNVFNRRKEKADRSDEKRRRRLKRSVLEA